jgi:hypothetical protein
MSTSTRPAARARSVCGPPAMWRSTRSSDHRRRCRIRSSDCHQR